MSNPYDKKYNLVGEDSRLKAAWKYTEAVLYLCCVSGVIGVLFWGFYILGK